MLRPEPAPDCCRDWHPAEQHPNAIIGILVRRLRKVNAAYRAIEECHRRMSRQGIIL